MLSNAIRYGSGRRIEVGFCCDGRMIQLSGRRLGAGISKERSGPHFRRFPQSSANSPKGSFGVGLWVTRQIVRTMEGEITVSSCPGKGSLFTVKLPLQPGAIDNAH